MARPMAKYINRRESPIRFGIGSAPGVPWTRYDSQPGGIVEGPANYQRAFFDAGYSLLTPEMERAMAEVPAVVAASEPAVEVAEDLKAVEEPKEPPPAKPLTLEPNRGKRRGNF